MKIITLIGLLLMASCSYAQEKNIESATNPILLKSINASGGNGQSSAGNISYTIGQTVYTLAESPDVSVQAGVQQAELQDKFFNIETAAATVQISAYPNPFTDYLVVNVTQTDASDLSCQIFDLKGSKIYEQELPHLKCKIQTNSLPSATYIMVIADHSVPLKTVKIIKS